MAMASDKTLVYQRDYTPSIAGRGATPKGGGRAGMGLSAPSIAPVWDRYAIPDPSKLPCGPSRFLTQVAKISPESIAHIKDECKDAMGQTCYNFDAVTAVMLCKGEAGGLPGQVIGDLNLPLEALESTSHGLAFIQQRCPVITIKPKESAVSTKSPEEAVKISPKAYLACR